MKLIPLRLWALTILSATLQLVPFPIAGPVPLWRRFFCWFCLVPLLMAVLGKDRKGRPLHPFQSAVLGYLCGVLWYTGNCYWIYQTMHIYGSIPELPSFGILVLFSLYLGLYLALFGLAVGFLRERFSPSVAVCSVPFLWTAIELARARITGFPWDVLGYTQVDNGVLTQLAPLGGVLLLSFAIAAVNALIVLGLFAEKHSGRTTRLALACTLAVLLQAGAFYHAPEDTAGHVAVLLQENLKVGAEGRDLTPYPMQQKFSDFTYLSRNPQLPWGRSVSELAQRDLIIWPEAPADFITSDPLFRAELGDLASSTHTPVIAGSVGIDFDPNAPHGYHEFGSAAVFNSDGTYIGRYDKITRVPWGEYVPYEQFFSTFAGKLISGVGSMEAGTQHKVFTLSGHKVGIFICYESIFGDEVRRFVQNGAEVLVNISDDGWYGDSGAPWQHLDMARMRAIENRRWVLRDTNTGITTAIDPHGRGDFTLPRHVRAAFALPFDYRSGLTFYTQFGDWFPWLCVIASVGALVVALNRRPQFA